MTAPAADTAPLIEPELARRVARALEHGGDFAEVFCEQRSGFSLSIDESRIERAQRGSERGAGVRVVSGDTTYFAHVDGLAEPDLMRAAERPRRRCPASAPSCGRSPRSSLRAAGDRGPPEDVPAERKAELLRELDERARAAGDEVAQVQASYAEGRRRVEVASSEGVHAADDRTSVRLGAQVVARRGDVVETGRDAWRRARLRARVDGAAEPLGAEAAGKALTLLGADPAPAGSMPVVVGKGFGGVLFHEMTGHGLEADAVQKGASVYAGKPGERVAEPLVTAYDDGARPARGDLRDRRRGDAVAKDGRDRGRRAASYLYDVVRARPRRIVDGERAPREPATCRSRG